MDRITQNPAELLRIVNITVGAFALAGGIGSIIHHGFGLFSSIIIGVYEIIAGAIIVVLELRTPSEHQKELVHSYASFMHSFLGRGVFYVFLGVLMLNNYLLLQICGGVVGLVGVAYIALHFLHPFEPPTTMQAPSNDPEAQPVWQAPSE